LLQPSIAFLAVSAEELTMEDPFPPPDERTYRARAVQRLRAAVEAAIRDGTEASHRGPESAALAQPLLNRLEQIARE
jgi:hypothetical protein